METPIKILQNQINVLDSVILYLFNNWETIIDDPQNPYCSWEDILKLIEDKQKEKDEFYAAITILRNTLENEISKY